MKKLLSLFAALVIVLQMVAAVGVGTGAGINIDPEQFAPRVFLDPNSRVV